MKLMFIGADHEVTGSCHFVQVADYNFLVDYGMEQGVNYFENVPLPVDAGSIDFVLLTHAHVDHSGMLPLLYKKGFRGQIFATEATADLSAIMLRDCAHIQMAEAEWKSRKGKRSGEHIEEAIYNMEDAEGTIRLLVPCPYDKEVEINDNVKIRFTDVGHLLGSSSIEVWLKEEGETKKIVFSGDIGNSDQPILRDPQYTSEADYVVMESTYGDRYHTHEKPDYINDLARIIQETFDKGGNVVIPSFAVGRTQEMLYFIRQIKEKELVKGYEDFPVYMDSPLAVAATSIFQKNQISCYDEEARALVKKGINPINFPGLKLAITSDESKNINFDDTPKVIISASGMCEAGRIRHHLKHNLWREESTILFVGYQAVGTLGRHIVEGAKEVKLFGENITVQARIMILPGMSGHADKDGLLKWIDGFDVKKPDWVFVVHGEDMVCQSFTDCLKKEKGLNAYAPYSGTVFNLLTGELEAEKAAIPIKKKVYVVNNVYNRLLAAAERLLSLVKKSEGRPNKELSKFADQIIALCDKWED